jgi:hypothetical protein
VGLRRSIVTSAIVFAFTGLFSLLGQGTGGQQPTYKVSGKLVGGPPVFASRFGPTVVFSLNLRPPARDDEREVAPVVLRGKLNADGSFEVLNVSPGTYVFMVNPAGAVLRSVPTIVVTNRDVTGLEIPLVLTDVVSNRQNLQTAWSLPGYWSGVATSKDGMFATSPAVDAATTPPFATATMPGHIREIDYDGTVRREIPIRPFRSMRLAVAHFSVSSAPVFLMYGSFVYAPNGGEPLTDVLGGQVYVVDAKQGTIIGSIDGQSLLPEVGWVAGEDGAAPRLVVSTGKALNGYIVGAK